MSELHDLSAQASMYQSQRQSAHEFSFELQRYRQQARDNLLSEQGMALRQQRSIEAETVFGDLKHNMSFRRFMLRGLKKVEIEWGLVCIAHNLRKLAIP